MSAQELFTEWLAKVNQFDISKQEDLFSLFRAVSELNLITQQAEKEIF